MDFPKFFNFSVEEKIIYSNWENAGCFKSKKSKTPYSIMMPPPNVTGSLHMGHALTFTIQDILIRFNRMKGKEVLWQAGTDHAGIATQMVVERQLNKNGIDRRSLDRKDFIEKVWEWKNESGGKINNQLRRLGASADWSRERFTMDDDLSKAVRTVFIDLYKEQIIYKDKRLVNWDPKLLTAISDLEVEQREQEGFLWHIKYPIDKNNHIIIATTRPETMLGDSAVAVNPNDKRYNALIGKFCNLPLSNKKIPIIADEYVDKEKGSGAVKITPAHDFNDFEVGKRHNLKFINIFDEYAKINSNVPKRFHNLDRYDARKLILKELTELNLLIKEEKQKMVVPYGDRSGVVIEPWLTEQWFCNAKKLSLEPIESVKKGFTKFIPKQWENTFFHWMEHIQPWCISRQLWWGHQIPAWYGPDKKFFVAFSEKQAIEQARIYYGKEVQLIQDQDVLDTWFSSALWTFSTLGWPEKSYELNRFYPGNVLVTGFDIIFFWVARMMMMGSYFMKNIPFKEVYIHPLIRDEKGQKMSKSKGNIIDPLELIKKYGADTLRFTLTALLNPGRDVKLSENRVKGYKSFTNKIWNAANFLQMNNCEFTSNLNINDIHLDTNKWILQELSDVSILVNKYIEKYLFHEVANHIYHFIWHTFCDWYIEFIKSDFYDSDKKNETKKVAGWVFGEILKLIHPLMPFISEKLWKLLFDKKEYLMLQNFSNFNINESFNQSKDKIKVIIELITAVRNLRAELDISYKIEINLFLEIKEIKFINIIKNYKDQLKRLLKIQSINFENINNKKNAAYLVLSNMSLLIPLEKIINTNQEIEKLCKRKESEIFNLKKIDTKLDNNDFIIKAPNHVVQDYKKQKKDIESSIEKIDQIINSIK